MVLEQYFSQPEAFSDLKFSDPWLFREVLLRKEGAAQKIAELIIGEKTGELKEAMPVWSCMVFENRKTCVAFHVLHGRESGDEDYGHWMKRYADYLVMNLLFYDPERLKKNNHIITICPSKVRSSNEVFLKQAVSMKAGIYGEMMKDRLSHMDHSILYFNETDMSRLSKEQICFVNYLRDGKAEGDLCRKLEEAVQEIRNDPLSEKAYLRSCEKEYEDRMNGFTSNASLAMETAFERLLKHGEVSVEAASVLGLDPEKFQPGYRKS